MRYSTLVIGVLIISLSIASLLSPWYKYETESISKISDVFTQSTEIKLNLRNAFGKKCSQSKCEEKHYEYSDKEIFSGGHTEKVNLNIKIELKFDRLFHLLSYLL